MIWMFRIKAEGYARLSRTFHFLLDWVCFSTTRGRLRFVSAHVSG